MDRFFNSDDIIRLDNKEYRVIKTLGNGSTCAAYLTQLDDKDFTYHRIIKEYNPDNIHITRDKNNNMIIDEKERGAFNKGLDNFLQAYKLHCNIRIDDDIGNTVSSTINKYDNYNTCYVELAADNGSNYKDILKSCDIKRKMRICRAIAGNVSAYHKKNYLCLDLKPENVFVLNTHSINADIRYIDFNSIKNKDELASETEIDGCMSYTIEWAAPEQIVPSYHRYISERTDIYSLGEILFFSVFGRHSKSFEHSSFSEYEFDDEYNKYPLATEILSDVFHKTICSYWNNRYETVDELLEKLDEVIEYMDKEYHVENSNININQSAFVGRKNFLRNISQCFADNNQIVWIRGFGGIGKSLIARKYFTDHKNEYQYHLYVVFNNSLEDTFGRDSSYSVFTRWK